VEWLKVKALSSSPSTANKKTKNQNKTNKSQYHQDQGKKESKKQTNPGLKEINTWKCLLVSCMANNGKSSNVCLLSLFKVLSHYIYLNTEPKSL
jgi:hypothetical protein